MNVIPAVIGPYRVLGRIGRGGMGVVYRATHRDRGPVVAIKTVGVPDELHLSAIRREIVALASIRHEGVVRILDEGVDGGIPWYAMELVDGPNLRDHLERDVAITTARGLDAATTEAADEGGLAGAETHPLSDPAPAPGSTGRSRAPSEVDARSLRDRLDIAVKICTALAHVHGEGFVHRDLKPENIVLRAGGTPVLVDFALALRFNDGRDPVDQDASPIGTLAYMAPEQIEGELVDARTDLYALGCVLYELCTGMVPFAGDPARIRYQHRWRVPEPPSRLNPAVPPGLDALVLSLLEKSPEARLGHATDVAAALVRLGAEPDPAARAPARAYLYRPSFVGRDDALTALTPWIEGIALGHGGAVFIGGVSGIGKTRVALEIARRARADGAVVVSGAGVVLDAEHDVRGAELHPFRPLLRAIADRCHAHPGTTRRLLGARGKVLAEVEPYLTGVPGYHALPEPEVLAPQAAREKLLQTLDDAIDAFAVAPILLVVDDLQWADELTLLYLKGRRDGDFTARRVAILGLYRLEEPSDGLRAAAGPVGPGHVVLGKLSDRSVGAMAGGMLALAPCPGHLARLLAEHAEGNPFFVAEYLRTAVAAGLLQRGPSGEWRLSGTALADESLAALPLPGSLRELMLRRLGLLSAEARAVADAASVIGREGDSALIAAIAGRAELLDGPAFRELLDRQVVEEPAAGRFRFLHDKFREVVHEALGPGDRRRLHGAAATAIEAAGVVAPMLGALAHHWQVAEVDDKAFDYLERAADHLLGAGAYHDAVRMLERAIERSPGPDAARRATWERRLAHAHLGLGHLEDCDRHARSALALLGRPAPRGALGWGALLGAEVVRQAAHLLLPARVFEQPPQRGALVEAALSAGPIARVGFFAGDPLKMMGASFLAVNLAERAGGAVEATRNYAGLGFMIGLLPIRPLAERYFERARRSGAATFDYPGLAFSLTSEAVYLLGAGRFGDARRVLDQAEEVCGKTGDPADAALVQTLFGHVDHYEGRFGAAIDRYGRVMSLARARKNPQAEAWSLYCTARSLLALDLCERAVDLLEETQRLLASQRDSMSEVTCAGLLAAAHLRTGNAADAARAADAAEALLRGVRPAAFLVAYGLEGVALVRLAQLERARSRRGPERRAAFAACHRLGAVVRIFPMVAPRAALAEGQAWALTGDRRRAAAALQQSLASAQAMGMPLAEALAHAALARVERGGKAAAHAESARALAEKLGCAHFLQGASPSG